MRELCSSSKPAGCRHPCPTRRVAAVELARLSISGACLCSWAHRLSTALSIPRRGCGSGQRRVDYWRSSIAPWPMRTEPGGRPVNTSGPGGARRGAHFFGSSVSALATPRAGLPRALDIASGIYAGGGEMILAGATCGIIRSQGRRRSRVRRRPAARRPDAPILVEWLAAATSSRQVVRRHFRWP